MADKKQKPVMITTPVGIAKYPRLNTPDTKFNADGVYKVDVVVPAAIAEPICKQIDAVIADNLQKVKEDKANKGKRIKEQDPPYVCNTEDDTVTFRCKMNAKIKVKDEVVAIAPKLFDSKAKPLPKDVKIGGGSKIRASCEVIPYFKAAVGAGVTLRLGAVQVLELQTFGGRDAAGYGFGQEEGYEAEAEESFPGSDEDSEESSSETSGASGSANGEDF